LLARSGRVYQRRKMKKGRTYKSLYLPALTIVAAVFTLLVVIAVSTYQNISRDRGRVEEFLSREGLIIIRAVEAGIRADLPASRPDNSRVQRILEEVSKEPAIAAILLFDRRGQVAASIPAGRGSARIKDVASLSPLLKGKEAITRYQQEPGGERTFEVIKPLDPPSHQDPFGRISEGGPKISPRENPFREWEKDKFISVRLRLGTFARAREQDIHHALLMGAILVILATGALYFIFIIQNYYLVDRTLARMKTYTENVLESMADALVSIDQEKRIVTLNRKAAEILGGPEDKFKGRAIGQVLGGEVEGLFQGGEEEVIIRDRETEIRHSENNIPLSLSVAPLKDETGRRMGSVLLLRDLREIRDLQEKVRRSERLASLGRLAAGVAHEIRNPLSSIRGFAQFFMHRFRGQEKELGYASIMVKEVDRLNRVITELLDFARPKAPNREPHSLASIFDHSLKLLEPELTGKGIRIEKDCETGLPAIRVDRDQISQVFLNLLLNSMESMDGGGRIGVRIRHSTVEPCLEVVLSDTGKGISREDLGKVFEPFFSTKRKGTGLGLAIVHQIVDAHGGDITVESGEGEGTTFRVTLPLNP
jgi:two-component system sensor histidine kinase HydH